MTARALAGAGVLVTRPVRQAGDLIAAVEAAGGTAVPFPVLRIEARDADAIAADLRRLPAADIVIFTSPNAVRYGNAPQAAAAAQIAAIGPATRRALEDAGLAVTILPEGGFDSEHLLAAAELRDVAKVRVRIVRGVGGRELLAETLSERGAAVSYLEVYRRHPERPSAAAIERLNARWMSGGIQATTVMSVESFDNLWSLLPAGAREAMRRTPLVSPSKRVIQTVAEKLPGSPAFLATGPQAADMLHALIHAIAPGIRHER